ncbi:hypothetical protein A2415_00965 [candidate division WWE3 bacterium RIFOXYC1_FULL_39_7]|uniref:Uncharacterized protein n=2 Tax=Katanobacteria TaxID=422282 RepID=A0A1F4X703_UNCKA|nr:MAG: hypothetical protein A2415_00965 [candidate division WWE3 bacterium RIFOXYC1_FULL_39_7]OGC77438.1 MAG: hypothetical protein A2619_03765 [candidate division WWE3 bacterium RIFOXYD1_FULL_39_9]
MQESQPQNINPEQENNSNIIDDSGLIELAKKREEEIEQKRKKFNRIMFFAKIGLLIIGILIAAYIIYWKSTPTPPPPDFKVEDKPEPLPEPEPLTEWTQHKDEGLKIFVKYPPESRLFTYDTPSNKVEIVYDSMADDFSTVTEENLKQGYIFRITPLNIGIRTIDRITEIKRDSFKSRCPTTAVFSEITSTLVDTVDARTFDIRNCNSDYKVYYSPRFNIYYEIAQIYKGDFGVRQKFKSTTDEIFISFKFFPEGETLPEEPFKTYINEQLKFLFIHPNLDDTCCTIQGPPIQEARKEVVLVKPDTYVDQNTMDGLGVYIYNLRAAQTFEAFISAQKQLLIEEYTVVRGVAPKTEDSAIMVGQYESQMLKGYSWRGTYFVYTFIPQKNIVIIFSIKSTTPEFEKTILEETLKTFETF